jgi:hypothetical protein
MKKPIRTYEEFLAEGVLNELITLKDLKVIDEFISKLSKKIQNSNLIQQVKDFISMDKLDPYIGWEDILKHLSFEFRYKPELANIIKQEIAALK